MAEKRHRQLNQSPDVNFALQLLEECAFTSSREPINVTLLRALLKKHYLLSGDLQRLASAKDDTFRLRTDLSDHIVKVSSPDEREVFVAFETATMRFLEHRAPGLPVQRIKLTVDGRDNVALEMSGGRTRFLRIFNFIEGQLWVQTKPSTMQLSELGETLGRIDVALRSFVHPGDKRRLVYDIRHFHQLAGLLEYTSKARHRLLAKRIFHLFDDAIVPRLSDIETQAIHGDYSPYNVVGGSAEQGVREGCH